MTCHDARELFSDRIDEALGPDETARLDAHLAGCGECRAEWARFEHTVALVRRTEPVHAPAGFVDRVLEAAVPVPWYRRFARGLFLPVGIKLPVEAAAIVLVAGLAVMIFERSPKMQQASRYDAVTPGQATAPPAEQRRPATERAEEPVARADDRAAASSDLRRLEPLAKATPLQPERDVASAQRRETPEAKEHASGTATPGTAAPSTAAPATAPPETRAKRADEPLADRVQPPPASLPPSEPAEQGRRQEAPPATPGRDESARAAQSPVAQAAPPASRPAAQRTAALLPPAVSARLVAKDRDGAIAAIRAMAERAGARELARRPEERAETVDLAVARDAYPGFVRELGQLGTVTIERQPAELPPTVVVTIRVTD